MAGGGSRGRAGRGGGPRRFVLREVENLESICQRYRSTPIAELLAYHNLGEAPAAFDAPRLVVVSCMDFRIELRLPRKFAYVLRVAGADLRGREFDLGCALALARLRHVCVVGHSRCAMETIRDRRDAFHAGLAGLAPAGRIAALFDRQAPRRAIPSAVEFAASEAARLERLFPGVVAAPLFYAIESGRLHQIVSSA